MNFAIDCWIHRCVHFFYLFILFIFYEHDLWSLLFFFWRRNHWFIWRSEHGRGMRQEGVKPITSRVWSSRPEPMSVRPKPQQGCAVLRRWSKTPDGNELDGCDWVQIPGVNPKVSKKQSETTQAVNRPFKEDVGHSLLIIKATSAWLCEGPTWHKVQQVTWHDRNIFHYCSIVVFQYFRKTLTWIQVKVLKFKIVLK